MKKIEGKYFSVFIIMFFLQMNLFALEARDTIPKNKKILKNTVRFNISNPAVFGQNSLIFGYERTTGKHQSFSINFGQAGLPVFRSGDKTEGSAQIQKSNTDKGYHVSGDYRFYLKKENKYIAPHGVYIGPYLSYNYFERKINWTLNSPNFNGEVNTDFELQIGAFGIEMGYQFILWRRLALDFILISPGIASYNAKVTIDASLDANDQSDLFKAIQSRLSDKIPGYSLVVDSQTFESKGNSRTTAFGYRYIVHLGFRF